MPRPRERACLEHGLKLDLNKLARQRLVRPGSNCGPRHLQWAQTSTGDTIASGRVTSNMTGPHEGWVRIEAGTLDQTIRLRAQPRRFGGRQWYFVCPATGRSCSVLWLPPGATRFCSRQAWHGQVAYASQSASRVDRAHRGKAKIKARLIGTCDPDDWDLPPKPKWMRWATYRRLEDRFEQYDEVIEDHFVGAIGRLMRRG